MTPKRKQVVISSLGLCTASWLFPVHGNAAAVAPHEQPLENPSNFREHIAEEALYRYYNPLASLDEVKPLQKSEKPIQYKIKQGDTLSEIAQQFEISTQQLADFNGIANIHAIQAGKSLKIPYRSEQVRIEDGRNLGSLAKQYNVSKALIKQLNPELKKTGDILYIGQIVTVPKRVKVSPPATREPDRKDRNNSVQLASRAVSDEESATASEFSGQFAWPVSGQITSPYGMRGGRLHHGIDIWNAQEAGTQIKAAAPGVVIRAGYDGNYGNLIVIDHGDGWSTYYAHLSSIEVNKGQTVGSGARIGYMGQSGNATGYHLHFEVRKNGESMDPLNILP